MSKQACEFIKSGSDSLLEHLEPKLSDEDFAEVEHFIGNVGNAFDEMDMDANLLEERTQKLESEVKALEGMVYPMFIAVLVIAGYLILR